MPLLPRTRRMRALVTGIGFLLALAVALPLLLAGCALQTADEARPGDERDGRATVVLLHGLGRSANAMWTLAQRLEAAGYDVVTVDYDSIGEHPADVVANVTAQIDACCAARRGPVHFVGHSLGGLLVRAYLEQRRPPNLGRAVLIGTPNGGTPVVDRFRDRWWFQLAGATAQALGTDPDALPRGLGPPTYPVGIIAGEVAGLDNEDDLPGPDDGLVPVASTRLEGMADFLLVPVSHAALRYDAQVAAQTIAFLRTGRFTP